MHQNVCRTNYSNVLCMKFKFEKFQFFDRKWPIFFSKCSECINTHQNASKCMQNELCKCFVQENIKEVVFITFKWAKIDELLVSLCDGRPCRLWNLVYPPISIYNLHVPCGNAKASLSNF